MPETVVERAIGTAVAELSSINTPEGPMTTSAPDVSGVSAPQGPRRRRVAGEQQGAAVDAALGAPPVRKKKFQTQGGPRAFLTTWEAAPEHARDNEFIIRGYRAGHNLKNSLLSVFRIHNETGNIWTHLIGFIIFICLTIATIHLRPAPLRLGADTLAALEHRMAALGNPPGSVYDLLVTAGSWERSVRKQGAEGLRALEERLRSIGQHNMSEVAAVADSLAAQLGHAASSIKAYGASGMAELAQMEARLEERLSALGGEIAELASVRQGRRALKELEKGLHRALASVLDPGSKWPVSRWPMYVFTAGAMVCLFTSSVCHIFGCCAAHIAAVMWRFDYAGIAVLIVASFFPPVYYGFLCRPALRAMYLLSTSILGVSTLGVTLLDRFQEPRFHPFRALLFVSLGLWGLVPMTHGLVINGGASEVGLAMRLDILMGAIYILGAAIYAARVPERWKPGAFDVAFHSHQIFHVAVVIAAVVHWKASFIMMHWRDATGGCLAL